MSGHRLGTTYDVYRLYGAANVIRDSISMGTVRYTRGFLPSRLNADFSLFGLRTWGQGRPVGARKLPAKIESFSTEWYRVPLESDFRPRVQYYWSPQSISLHYQFVNPLLKLYVDLDQASDSYVVSDEYSSIYGTGATLIAARRNYFRDLLDYFAKLEEREDHLAKGLRQELKELRRHIARRP